MDGVFFVPKFSYGEDRGIVAGATYDSGKASVSWNCKKIVKFRAKIKNAAHATQ